MKSSKHWIPGVLVALTTGCAGEPAMWNEVAAHEVRTGELAASPASIGIVGNGGDVSTTTTPGTVLMGGGVDVDEAMKWMIDKSGGGDFVVIRATGTDAYNPYLYALGTLDSVETLRIDSADLARDPGVAQTIRNAEALFIAGGDQHDYVRYWKDTPVADALNYLINEKKVPVGGTSAGSAIQGEAYFDAANGTIRSEAALRNPYDRQLSLQASNFLKVPYLEQTITDTHYDEPDRRGRHVTFLARMVKDWGMDARGIGVDERTAVCIEADGRARVFGEGYAFFLRQDGKSPERCEPHRSLVSYHGQRAVGVYKIRGSQQGAGYFDLSDWSTGANGNAQYYYVDQGSLGISY